MARIFILCRSFDCDAEFDQRSQSSAFFEENPVSLLVGLLATGMHRVVLISAAYEVTNTVR